MSNEQLADAIKATMVFLDLIKERDTSIYIKLSVHLELLLEEQRKRARAA